MIVIDASSISKYLLRGENWREVEEKIDAGEPVCSIDYAMVEVTNSIRTEYLKKNLSASDSFMVFEALEKIYNGTIKIEPFGTYIKDALKLGMAEKTSVYDALYIVQALKYGKLLTSDGSQGKMAIRLGIETTLIE